MSLFKETLWNLPQAERDSLYKAGTISVFSTQEPFARVWHYGVPVETRWQDRVKLYPNTPHRKVPVLDISEFPENGSNLNHWTYLVVAREQAKDVNWAILNHPEVFAKTFWMTVQLSFKPGYTWFTYIGHHGRRRANLDSLRAYISWLNNTEWQTKLDGGNIQYEK